MHNLVDFLKAIPPFGLLPDDELQQVVKYIEIKEFEKGVVIYEQGKSEIKYLSVVYQGKLEKYFLNHRKEKESIEISSAGEIFGVISILLNEHKAIRTIETVEPTVLYQIPADVFTFLCQNHPDFSNYFTERFGRRMLNEDYASHFIRKNISESNFDSSDSFFTQKISKLYKKQIAACSGTATIREAAVEMTHNKTGSLLVKNDAGEYIGVVTDIDLRNKVVAAGHSVDAPVGDIMSAPLITISDQAYIYEAILLMFRKKINHLVVTNNGKIDGILTRNQLMFSQTKSPFIFIQSVNQASSADELKEKWMQVPAIVNQLLTRGVKADIVNQIITSITDAITQNIIQNTLKELGKPPADFIYMVFGSEGRKEQTLSTDQDNAIIYADTYSEKRETVRKYFLKLGEIVSDKLNEVGFPYCKGNFMAKNPKWCHSLSHWKDNFKDWMQNPEPYNAMKYIIFFDCRAVYGKTELMDSLKEYINELAASQSDRFFYQLTKNSLEVKPPLTLFRNFLLIAAENNKKVLDIKRSMRPVVDFARIYALKNQIKDNNTGERLKSLMEAGVLNQEEYEELLHAYYYLMQIRLLNQANAIKEGRAADNYVDPKDLTKVERVALKEVFKVIENYQTRLSIYFTGSFN